MQGGVADVKTVVEKESKLDKECPVEEALESQRSATAEPLAQKGAGGPLDEPCGLVKLQGLRTEHADILERRHVWLDPGPHALPQPSQKRR